MSGYRVSIPGPEESAEAMTRLKGGPENKAQRRTALLEGGLEMKGSFEITCRDVRSGEIAWTHADENLITDWGRRGWMYNRFSSLCVGFAPTTETPLSSRYSIAGDVNQLLVSGNLTPSNNIVTNTKTLSTTFGTPASNRTLGTIFIVLPFYVVNAQGWVPGIVAYALLTPPKTQTTVQTLEVVYKISMSPIY